MINPDDQDLRCCVFRALYKRIGVNQWIRHGRPEICVLDSPGADEFAKPVIRDVTADLSKQTVEIRYFDPSAVALHRDDLLGEWVEAAERCDRALLEHFPNDVIVRNLSQW